MSRPTTLAAWLAYLETLHPKAIAMGLDRVAAVHARMARGARLPGRHGHRHQRQGLDLRAAGGDAARGRLPDRPLHVAAPRALQRARPHRRRAARRRRARRGVQRGRGRARRRFRSRTSSTARSPRCGCSRAPALDVGDPRSGTRRAARRGQHRRCRRRRRDQRRSRSHGLPRARRARTSAARRPASSGRGGRSSAREPDPPAVARRRTRARIGAPRRC